MNENIPEPRSEPAKHPSVEARLTPVVDLLIQRSRARPGVRGLATLGWTMGLVPGHRSVSFLVCCDEEDRDALMASPPMIGGTDLLSADPDPERKRLDLLCEGLLDLRLSLHTPEEIRGMEGPGELGDQIGLGYSILYDPEDLLAALATRVAPSPRGEESAEIPSSVFWYNVAFCANLIMRGDLFRAAMFSHWYLQIWLVSLVLDTDRAGWMRHIERRLEGELFRMLASTFGPLTPRGMREGLLNAMRCFWTFQSSGAPELDSETLSRYRRIEATVREGFAQKSPASEAHGIATSESIVTLLRACSGVKGIAVVGSRSGADPTRIDAYSDLDLFVCCDEAARKELLSAQWCSQIAEPVLVFPPLMDDELRVLFDRLFDCELHFMSPEEIGQLHGSCELGDYAEAGFRIVHDPEGILARLVERIRPESDEGRDAEAVSVSFWHSVARCANLVADGDLFQAAHAAHWGLQIRLLELIVDNRRQGWEKYIDRQLTTEHYELLASSILDLSPSRMRLGLFNAMRCYWEFQRAAAPQLERALLERFRRIEAEVIEALRQ